MPKKKKPAPRKKPAPPDPNESAYSVVQQIIRKTEAEDAPAEAEALQKKPAKPA